MTERKHNLPDGYERLDEQIAGPVVDAIAVHPRSYGRLYLPGQWSTSSRPPGHAIDISSTSTDNDSVYYDERLIGSPERYTVTYDVWNHRDSHSSARIVLTDHADQSQSDTPEG